MYEIEPYVGVDEIKFGMTWEEIYQIMGDEYTRIDNSYVPGFSIYYPHLKISFDENGHCEAIEGNQLAGFYYKDIEIAGKSFKVIKKIFEKMDSTLDIDANGFRSYKLGIGVYVPTLKKSQKELVQGVIAFKKGYYDDDIITYL